VRQPAPLAAVIGEAELKQHGVYTVPAIACLRQSFWLLYLQQAAYPAGRACWLTGSKLLHSCAKMPEQLMSD
jgi:hypothetical protein